MLLLKQQRQQPAWQRVPRLLDGRGDVAAAFSMRRIRKAYTGALVRLRRSSDNTEVDFSGALFVSMPSILSWLNGGSGFVSKWYDQSGLGRDLVQATQSQQPAFGVLSNGLPGMTFDGSNDYLQTATFTFTQPWSFNVIYRRVADVQISQENMVDGGLTGNSALYHEIGGATNRLLAGNAGPGLGSASMPTSTRGAVGGTFNGASALLEVNAVTLASATGDVGGANPNGLTIGTQGNVASQRASNIEAQELVAFNTAHTSAQLKADNAAMRSSWRF